MQLEHDTRGPLLLLPFDSAPVSDVKKETSLPMALALAVLLL